MVLDDCILSLAKTGVFPRDALRWAVDHWDEAAPRFVETLEGYADAEDLSEATANALFFMIHLLAEKREKRALAPLCRMLLDSESAEECLGDAITANLRDILIAIGGDDLTALKRVIEAPTADEYARASALEALAWHTRAGALTDAEMRAYLTHLRDSMQPQGECFVWDAWVMSAANLGYADFYADAERLIRLGLVPEMDMNIAHFRRQLQRTLDDPTGWASFEYERFHPFADTIGTLQTWHYEAPDQDKPLQAEREETASIWDQYTPYTNPFRDVGRNDPCPCGSGKKFKKCHLV